MPFSEKLKLEARRRAAFRCCICQQTGVDVHHILPEKQGGSNEIDNAAPLCQNCHDQLGANPEKRKSIKDMRDWWYDVCDKRYGTQGVGEETISRLDKLDQTVANIEKGQKELGPSFINQIKDLLQGWGGQITPAAAASLGSAVVASTTGIIGPFLGSPMGSLDMFGGRKELSEIRQDSNGYYFITRVQNETVDVEKEVREALKPCGVPSPMDVIADHTAGSEFGRVSGTMSTDEQLRKTQVECVHSYLLEHGSRAEWGV